MTRLQWLRIVLNFFLRGLVDHHHFCTLPYDGNWQWRKISSTLGLLLEASGTIQKLIFPPHDENCPHHCLDYLVFFLSISYTTRTYLSTCDFCGMGVSPSKDMDMWYITSTNLEWINLFVFYCAFSMILKICLI